MLLVLCVTLSVVGVQVVGGLLSGSSALLADAGHLPTDAAGVGIAVRRQLSEHDHRVGVTEFAVT